MADMKLTRTEAAEESGASPKLPEYPWGLSISLDTESLKKLGYDEALTVGKYFTLTARVCVTSASSSQQQDGEKCEGNGLQIEEMEIKPVADGEKLEDVLYKRA